MLRKARFVPFFFAGLVAFAVACVDQHGDDANEASADIGEASTCAIGFKDSTIAVNGQGGFLARTLTTGDVNADGKRDVVVHSEKALHVFLGDGKGGFTQAPNVEVDMRPGYDELDDTLAIADLDGDGNRDLVAGLGHIARGARWHERQSLLVFAGHGDGTFEAKPLSIAVGRRELGDGYMGFLLPILDRAVTGDFDGDGIQDVLVTTNIQSGGGGPVRFSTGAGASFLLAGVKGGPPVTSPKLTHDLNAHGHWAIAPFDGKRPSAIVPYSGLLNGEPKLVTFVGRDRVKTTTGPALNGDYANVAAADANKDGKLDAVVEYFDSSKKSMAMTALVGDGAGAFAPSGMPVTALGTNKVPNYFEAGDFDGDGAADGMGVDIHGVLDLVCAVGSDKPVANRIQLELSSFISAMSSSDFDGDGRTDLVWVDGSNIHVALSRPGPKPRLGVDAGIDSSAPADAGLKSADASKLVKDAGAGGASEDAMTAPDGAVFVPAPKADTKEGSEEVETPDDEAELPYEPYEPMKRRPAPPSESASEDVPAPPGMPTPKTASCTAAPGSASSSGGAAGLALFAVAALVRRSPRKRNGR